MAQSQFGHLALHLLRELGKFLFRDKNARLLTSARGSFELAGLTLFFRRGFAT